MSMINFIVHREEEVTRGLNFAPKLGPEETITSVEMVRVRRMVDRALQDVTSEVLDMRNDEPATTIEGSVVLFRKIAAPGEDSQPPGIYYLTVQVRTSDRERPIGYDIDGRDPTITITDGVR